MSLLLHPFKKHFIVIRSLSVPFMVGHAHTGGVSSFSFQFLAFVFWTCVLTQVSDATLAHFWSSDKESKKVHSSLSHLHSIFRSLNISQRHSQTARHWGKAKSSKPSRTKMTLTYLLSRTSSPNQFTTNSTNSAKMRARTHTATQACMRGRIKALTKFLPLSALWLRTWMRLCNHRW